MLGLEFCAEARRRQALIVGLVHQVAQIELGRTLVSVGMVLQADARLSRTIVEHQLAVGAAAALAGAKCLRLEA